MDNQNFVRNIRNICKKKGISISQVETDLGWSVGLISRWTKACPSFEKVVDIVNYLGVTYESLLEGGDIPEDHTIPPKLLQKLTRLSQKGTITWLPCENDTAASKIIAPLVSEGCLAAPAYCFPYQKGYFFLVMAEDDLTPFSPRLYVAFDRNSLPALESDDGAALGPLLSVVDRELYDSWTVSRNRQMIKNFLNDPFDEQ